MSLIFSIVIKKIKHNHMTWHPFNPVWYHVIRLPLYNSNCQVNQHVRMKFGIGIKIMTHNGNLVISFIFVSGINNSNTRSYVIKIDPKNTFFTIFADNRNIHISYCQIYHISYIKIRSFLLPFKNDRNFVTQPSWHIFVNNC